jgi:septal ring factor EnvC (AmiA/AmiB activator)
MNKRTKEQIEIEIKVHRERCDQILENIAKLYDSMQAQQVNFKYCETEIKLLEGELNPIDNPLQDINACARMLGIGSRGFKQ